MEKQESRSARFGVLSGFIMFSVCIAGVNASAQTAKWFWTGNVSTNWADVGNWNTVDDGSGDTPEAISELVNQNVMLSTTGARLPSNQNVEGLSLGELMFPNTTTAFAIDGKPLIIARVHTANNNTHAIDQPVTFFNELIIKQSANMWAVRDKIPMMIRGGLSGTNGAQRFTANNGGKTHFLSPLAITGGFNSDQIETYFYGMETTGVHPTDVVNNSYFQGKNGRFVFNPPEGYPSSKLYEYEFNEYVGAQNVKFLFFQPSVAATFNGPISDTEAGFSTQKNYDGVLFMNGDFSLLGTLDVSNGMIVMNADIAAQDSASPLLSFGNGTVELNGNDVVDYRLRFANSTGFRDSGNVKNANMRKESVITGDFFQYSSGGNAVQFGGAGDILVLANITNAAASTSTHKFGKTGAGKLTLAGEYIHNGSFEVAAGMLCLDYGLSNTSKIGDTAEIRLNGSLSLLGNATADSVETIGHINAGHNNNENTSNHIRISAEGRDAHSMSLRFSTLNAYKNSSVDFATGAGGAILSSGAVNAAELGFSIMGPRMTFNGSSYARVAATANDGYYAIEGLPDNEYDAAFDSASDTEIVDILANTVISAAETAAAIRFDNSQATNLTLNAALNFRGGNAANGHSGGILVTENVGANPVVIEGTGALLGSAEVNGVLHIHQYNTNAPLIIGARVCQTSSGNCLLKSGPGELVLTNRSNMAANLFLYEGTVTAHSLRNRSTSSAGGYGSTIYFGNATFKYVGEGDSTDKLFRLRGHATLDASGSGPLALTNAKSFDSYYGSDHRLTLTGKGEGEILGVMDLKLGSLRKTGSGAWTLGAPTYGADIAVTNYFWGGTTIEEGKLVVNCALGRDVTIAAGGTLASAGTILHNLNINGTLEVNPDDGIITVEHDTIIDGATLSIAGGMVKGEFVEILKTDGKIIGEFANVSSRYKVRYAPNSIEVQDKIVETLIIVK